MQPHQELLKSGRVTQAGRQHDTALNTDYPYFHLRNGEEISRKPLIFVNGKSESVRLLFLPNKCVLGARRKFRSRQFSSHFEVVNSALLCLWCYGPSLGTRRPKEKKEENKYFETRGNARIKVRLRSFRVTVLQWKRNKYHIF